jgi:hypothetical protein
VRRQAVCVDVGNQPSASAFKAQTNAETARIDNAHPMHLREVVDEDRFCPPFWLLNLCASRLDCCRPEFDHQNDATF